MTVEEGEGATGCLLQLGVAFGRAFQQEGVASLQENLTWLTLYTVALTGHSHQSHVVLLLKVALCYRLAYQFTAKGDVGRAHLALGVNVIDAPHVFVGSRQAVCAFQFQNLVDLSGVDQSVAAQNPLVLGHRHDNLAVEAYNLYQRAAFHVVQSCIRHRLAHRRIVCGHQQFHGIVTGGLERLLC